MTTWRDVKWVYFVKVGWVMACVPAGAVLVCSVPEGDCQDEIGRAIAHAWNVDLAAARSWRELYSIDDSVRTRED